MRATRATGGWTIATKLLLLVLGVESFQILSNQRITSPRAGATLRGVATVSGSAHFATFAFYKLEVRPDGDAVWRNFAQSSSPVDNGALGSLNTALFSNGLYWLQLSVVDKTGNVPVPPCSIMVRFTN